MQSKATTTAEATNSQWTGWSHATEAGILRNPIYRGAVRWGLESTGRYHTVQGGDIVSANKGHKRTRKPAEDTILVEAAECAVVSPKLFDRVQRKLAKRTQGRHAARAAYSLSGLVHCEHCGRPMHGCTVRRPDRQGRKTYAYPRYVCASYSAKGKHNSAGCGHFAVDAPELARELAAAKDERDMVKTALAAAAAYKAPEDVQKEARRIASTVWRLGERLTDADPATLRELFRQMVSRITCRFEKVARKGGRQFTRLVEGRVELRPSAMFDCLSSDGVHAGRWQGTTWSVLLSVVLMSRTSTTSFIPPGGPLFHRIRTSFRNLPRTHMLFVSIFCPSSLL